MASNPERHPCEGRVAHAPWKRDHLYLGDSGQVLCGACMGIESTYTPWQWSDLGVMGPDRSVTVEFEEVARGGIARRRWTVRCETDQYAHRAR